MMLADALISDNARHRRPRAGLSIFPVMRGSTGLIANHPAQESQYNVLNGLLCITRLAHTGVAESFLAAYRDPQTAMTDGKGWVMALTKCRECDHEISNQAKACPNCGARKKSWPLTKFTRFYFISGFGFVVLYALAIDPYLLGYFAAIWLLVGFGLALIAYGRARRSESDVAGTVYLIGIAWLLVLLLVGIFRILDPLYRYAISGQL